MKQFLALITIAFSFLSFAQEDGIQRPKITEYPMTESSLLWQITSDNTKDTSYLFGTMHMIEEEYFIFPDKLSALVSKSDILVMELAGTPNPYAIIGHIMLKEGSVFDFFTDKQEDTLVQWVTNEIGMEEAAFRSTFNGMKPFALLQLSLSDMMGSDTKSYETEFENIAKADSVEIIGLETIADQMKIFDDMTMDEQAIIVMESIRGDKEEAAAALKEMEETYFSQEIDSLNMLFSAAGGILAEKEDAFLSDRNKNWIPLIQSIIDVEKGFIAVGAGHLGGREGVIRLLEAEGYTLTPIKL